ncbi:hypothetical protein [Stenotrophomonas sp. PS02298]|uniref:hypothetical protein n=1 Tax=Stenotrophomonas sp. PS02298 TaxID=2991424 RepID=UPI002499CF45|nr:hypothetical protein [Stenotrophomonas sp. PS02298]
MRMACLLLFLPFMASAAPLLRGEGVATTRDGAVAYREVHWQRGAGDAAERWVHYLCPDGQPFARKHMQVNGSAQAPSYRWEDRRSGQTASVAATGGVVQLNWKEDAAAKTRAQRLPLPADAVIDAGFDAAVRAHWQQLMQGERLSLQFLVPGRQRYYPVQVQRVGSIRWQGLDAQSIQVQLDAWYGVVAPRLALVYADADRRLLEFHGTSNLRDARGDYPVVTVRFAQKAVERPQAQWQAELQQVLVPRCIATRGGS